MFTFPTTFQKFSIVIRILQFYSLIGKADTNLQNGRAQRCIKLLGQSTRRPSSSQGTESASQRTAYNVVAVRTFSSLRSVTQPEACNTGTPRTGPSRWGSPALAKGMEGPGTPRLQVRQRVDPPGETRGPGSHRVRSRSFLWLHQLLEISEAETH